MAASSKKQDGTISKAQGLNYNIPAFTYPWDVKGLTIDDIEKYKENIYVYKVVSNLTNLIFQKQYICNILDPKGNSREDVAEWFRVMLQDIEFGDKLVHTFQDWCYYGNYFHSDGAARLEGKAVYTEIRELPPVSFVSYGLVMSADYDYGKLFKGICRDEKGEMHYWQKQKYDSVELKNCKVIKSPVHTYNLDGIPILAPVYKLIPKLDFSMNTLMQCENRAGAPTMFMQVLQPGKLPDGKTDNWYYSNQILKNYDKNTLFTIPASIVPIEITAPIPDISLKAVELLTKLLISLFSTTDFISKGEGELIGGSSSAELSLLKSFVVGFHKPIIKAWTEVLNLVLEWNGFVGFKVELILPEPEFKNEDLDFLRAQEIIKDVKEGLVVGSINEVREFLCLEDGSPEFFAKSKQEWEDVKIETIAQQSLNAQLENQTLLADKQAENQARAQEQKNVQQNAPLDNKQIKEDQNQQKKTPPNLKQNQGIPTREDSEVTLKKELAEHWDSFFAAMYEGMTKKKR